MQRARCMFCNMFPRDKCKWQLFGNLGLRGVVRRVGCSEEESHELRLRDGFDFR